MVPASRSSRVAVSYFALVATSLAWQPVNVAGQGPSIAPVAVNASAPTPSPPSTLTSIEEQEAFLAKAKVVRARSAARGVTNTLRVTLSDGTITHDASVQTIEEAHAVFQTPLGTEFNFKDSWRYNVAAYKVDRLLEIGMTPPSVERRYNAKPGSFTWWVDEVLMDEQERYRKGHSAPSTDDWNQQMWITRLFDQLIANVDRNLGNLVIDKGWNIWMIDHSRAFRLNTTLRSPGNLSKVERRLLEKLRTLDREGLRKAAGRYLSNAEIDALLTRRDAIVSHFDQGGPTLIFDRAARCCH